MKRNRVFVVAAAILGLLLAGKAAPVWSQAAAPFPVLIQNNRGQETLRVNPTVTPNRTEFGCEADQIGGTTINGVRIVGAVTGSGPTIQGIPCTGGDTNQVLNIQGAGSSGVAFPNGVTSIGSTTANFITLDAADACSTFSASTLALKTRTATGDWAYTRTGAGAETHFFKCSIPLTAFRTTASKGIRIDSGSLAYTIGTLALTTFNAPTLQTTVYANNVATAVTTYGGAVTFTGATATQANPYVTAFTLATPAFMNTANANVNLEFSVVLQSTTVFTFRALIVNYTLAIL